MCFYLFKEDRSIKTAVFDIDHSLCVSYRNSQRDVRNGLCQGKDFPSKLWSGHFLKYSVASLRGKCFKETEKESFI